jgi:hypothetical protein
MSFDPDGIKKRLELDTDGTLFSSLPLSTDESVITAYFDAKYNRVPGLEEAFRASEITASSKASRSSRAMARAAGSRGLAKSITITVDGQSVTNPQVGQVIDQCWLGNIVSFADYSAGLNAIANQCYNDALGTFSTIYSGLIPT